MVSGVMVFLVIGVPTDDGRPRTEILRCPIPRRHTVRQTPRQAAP
jgi:hypothetical protein